MPPGEQSTSVLGGSGCVRGAGWVVLPGISTVLDLDSYRLVTLRASSVPGCDRQGLPRPVMEPLDQPVPRDFTQM
jgi:hypothetical protein